MDKENKLDKGTFGKTKAAHDLVDILNDLNDSRITRRTSTILQKYHKAVLDILNTKSITLELLKMWHDKFKLSLVHANLPKDVKTRVANVATVRYRKEIKNIKNEY